MIGHSGRGWVRCFDCSNNNKQKRCFKNVVQLTMIKEVKLAKTNLMMQNWSSAARGNLLLDYFLSPFCTRHEKTAEAPVRNSTMVMGTADEEVAVGCRSTATTQRQSYDRDERRSQRRGSFDARTLLPPFSLPGEFERTVPPPPPCAPLILGWIFSRNREAK